MTRALAAAVLLALPPARAADRPALTDDSSGPAQLTLPGCVAKALSDAVPVLEAAHADRAAAARLLQGYAQFLPNLETQGDYSQIRGPQNLTFAQPIIVDSRNRGYSYQVSSTLNLFNGLADYGAFKTALGGRRAAALTLERARQQIALDIAQAYLQVKLDDEIVRFGEGNLKASEERESLLDQQTQVGERGLPDLYRQQAQTSADRSFLIDARNKRHDDLLALLRRARYDMGRDYALADVAVDSAAAQVPSGDESGLVTGALDARPDLRAAFERVEAAGGALTSARSGYFPRLDLGWSMASTSRLYDTDYVNGVNFVPAFQSSLGSQLDQYVNYTVGVTAKWGIFDRLTTFSASKQAAAALADARVEYEDARLAVEQDVKQALGDFHAAEQKLEAARQGVKAAGESYDATAERYQVAASSLLDLLTAQSALLQSQAALAQARIGLYLQARQMEFALGRMPVLGAAER